MSLLKEHYHRTIFYYSLLLIALTLPFAIKLNSFFIIVLCANWLVEGNFKIKMRMFLSHRTAILFLAFYLLHLAGMLYTSNTANGIFELEKKLSLVLLPLVLSTTSPLDRAMSLRILKVFVLSCTLAAIICAVTAAYRFFNQGDASAFFYHDLSKVLGLHAVYFSFYLVFCIFIIMDWYRSAGRKLRPWLISCILFLLIVMFLLSSKIILISAFLLINGLFLFSILSSGSDLRGIGLLLLINLAIASLVISVPAIRERFSREMSSDWSVLHQRDHRHDSPFTGTSLRLMIWKFCLEILDDKNAWLLGTGTGDGQDLLDEKYRQYHLYTGYEGTTDRGYLGYNAHNQYMNTLLCHGIIGLLLLLACLWFCIKHAWGKKKLLLLGMLLLFCFFSFTETTLATHKGAVFFAFFSSLLLYQYRENDTEK